MSTLQRLAPSTALLGSELPPSNYENPGPGSYMGPPEWRKENKLDVIKEAQECRGRE